MWRNLTRPVPINVLLPHLIKRIRRNRIPYEGIKIVIALGLHRKLSTEEKRGLVGKISEEEIEIINHDPYDKSKLVKLREDFQGDHDIFINKTVADADIKILSGDIVPHQLFGYGGGAKNVLSGTTDTCTICM